jgi:Tfp pilus assembly protein PilZ
MDFNARALITYADSSFTGTVENLSLKGLFVKTDQRIPLEETVNILLTFSGSNGNVSLTLEGKVVRITEDGIGLNFKKISIDSLEQTLADSGECADTDCRFVGELCQAAV